jgi:hypothetical protein
MPVTPFQCPDCGSLDAYRSRPRNWIERVVLPLLYLRPARCGDCFRRSYVFLSIPVLERAEATLHKGANKAEANSAAA